MKFKRHTIILLVGPSNSGKSTFASQLDSELNRRGYSSCIVSSDDCRRKLLNRNLDKYDRKMMVASSQAFDMLEMEVKLRTTYPINNDFVIVDSTGLNEEFRKGIAKIAEENKYRLDCVVFDIPRNLYTDFGPITRKHYLKLKEEMKNLGRGKFHQKHIIKNRDPITFEVEPILGYEIKITGPTAIIGDIHGCYDEFRELLGKIGVKIEDGKIVSSPYTLVSVGDYIDKGPKVKETVDFLYNNRDKIHILKANHESWVEGYWNGRFQDNSDLSSTLFSSAMIEDPDFRKKLTELYSLSYPFIQGDNWIATHAPCRNSELGKDFTEKQQRNFRYTQFPDIWEALQFLYEDDNSCYPYHIFGHISFDKVFRNKTKIGIDTGCASGGNLTCVIMEGRKPEFVSVPSKQPKTKDLFSRPEKKFTEDMLDPKQLGRFRRMRDAGIKFISGTMSPANKFGDTLESMDWALDYYSKFTDTVCIQVKQMGSRANVYLYDDPDKCFVVSRNGYIPKLDLNKEYIRLIERFREDFDTLDREMFILDAELMPWSALGKGLIDDTFKPHYILASLDNVDVPLNFEMESIGNKDEYIAKHGHHNYNTALGLRELKKFVVGQDVAQSYLDKYNKSLSNFTSDCEPYLKPFSILYHKNKDGTEYVYKEEQNSTLYYKVNDDICWVMPVTHKEVAHSVFDTVCSLGYEGVVVKPDRVYIKDCAPYLKVRSPEYLRLTYGPDYNEPTKYDKLMYRKQVGRKLGKSINEFELGMRMLTGDESAMIEFILKDKEQGIDPRL